NLYDAFAFVLQCSREIFWKLKRNLHTAQRLIYGLRRSSRTASAVCGCMVCGFDDPRSSDDPDGLWRRRRPRSGCGMVIADAAPNIYKIGHAQEFPQKQAEHVSERASHSPSSSTVRRAEAPP